jgi:ABC-2 type transport system permease protein
MTDISPGARATRPLPSAATLLAAQVSYQFRLLLATPSALAIGVGLPVVLLIVGNARHGGDAVANVAGYAVLGLTMAAWNTHGVRLVAARELGILRRWRAAPLPPWCYFAGRVAATALFATLAALVTLLTGVLFDGVSLSAGAAVAVLPALVLGALAWAAASTAMSSVVPGVGAASPAFLLTYFPVVLISGVLGPISGEPHWLTTLAGYLPAEPVIDVVGRALGHGPAFSPHDLLVLAAWAVVGLAVASARFRWEPHRPAHGRPARGGPAHGAGEPPADPRGGGRAPVGAASGKARA